MILNSPYISGSLTVTGNITAQGGINISGSIASASYAVSASEASKLQGLGSSSFAPAATFNIVSQSYAASSASLSTRVTTNETNISTLTSASSSFATMSGSLSTRVTNLEATSSTVSQSFASTSGSISGRVTLIEGQYATTGSNTFTSPQFINQASNAIGFTSTASLYTNGGLRVSKDSFVSGTAYFNNVVVYGTSSIQYITSSQVNFGTNIITVNTDTPAVRFGGLSVFDSGSTQLTGSILWDSQNNHWIYSNPSGSSYNSAMLMNGPRNTGSLGTEQGTTNNALMKGQGGDHITSSQMIDDGTTVRIPGALQVTGSTILASTLTGTSAAFTGSVNVSGSFVVTTTAPELQVGATGVTLGNALTDIHQATGSLRVTGSGVSYFLGGNVGVGTAAPNRVLDVNGVIRTQNAGSAGAPSIELGTSAQGNGLFYPTTNTIAIATNDTERLRITSGGNLQVTGSAIFSSSVTAGNGFVATGYPAASGNGLFIAYNSAGSNTGSLYSYNYSTSTYNPTIIDGSNVYVYNSGVVKMAVVGGNVGIGTTSPGARLEVVGVDENVLKLKNGSGQPALVRFNDTSTTADPYVGSYGNDLAFGIYGVGESMRINSSRNVGIRTTSPFSLLHVGTRPGAGNTNPSLNSTLTVSNDGQTGIDLGGNVNANNVVGQINWVNYLGVGNYNTARIDVYANGGSNSGDLRFWTATASSSPTIRLTIASTGAATFSSSVTANKFISNATDDGIGQYFWFTGNAAVSNNFSVYAYSNNVYINAYQNMVIRANQGTTGGSIQLGGGNVLIGSGTNYWQSPFTSLDISSTFTAACLGSSYAGIYENIYYDGSTYRFKVAGYGTSYVLSTSDGSHNFATWGTGAANAEATGVSRMLITNSGQLQVGNSSISAEVIKVTGATGADNYISVYSGTIQMFLDADATNSAGIVGTQSNHNMKLRSAGINRMNIDTSGNIGAPNSGTNIYNASDIRLKKNITTITNGLDKISALNPVKFNWIDGFVESEEGKDMLGFIAQEVQIVVPEAVESFSSNSIVVGEAVIEDPLRVNEKFIIPVLVKAIQEQQAQIEALKARIETLEK